MNITIASSNQDIKKNSKLLEAINKLNVILSKGRKTFAQDSKGNSVEMNVLLATKENKDLVEFLFHNAFFITENENQVAFNIIAQYDILNENERIYFRPIGRIKEAMDLINSYIKNDKQELLKEKMNVYLNAPNEIQMRNNLI